VAFFNTFTWSGTMDREAIKSDPDALADIWRSAERRRAEDIGTWLVRVFEKPRPLKAPDVDSAYPQGHPALR
jgi:hypothetical protein